MEAIRPLKNMRMAGVLVSSYKIKLSGEFIALNKLIKHFAQSTLPLMVDDFSLHSKEQGNMEIEMRLFVFYVDTALPKIIDTKSIFENKLQDILAQQIHWVGYMKQGAIFWGLLMLPQGNTLAVSPGSIIGKEKARVISIDQNKMIIEINGEQKVITYLI